MKNTLRPANINVIIEGHAIFMRPISEAEISDRYLGWLHDPDVVQYLDEVRHKRQTKEDIISYINGLRSREGCELFAIFTKNNGFYIGNIGVAIYNPHHQGYAGYGIMIGDKKAKALGLGGEATILIVEFLFRDAKIRRLQENTYAENEKSWKTLESLGFKKEGILRQHVVLSSGKICDLYIHGMLREEWMEHRQKVANVLKEMKVSEYTEV